MKEEDIQSVSLSSEEPREHRAKVRFEGSLLRAAHVKEDAQEYVITPKKLSDVLDLMMRNHQMDIRRDSTLILVNGVEARALDDLDTMIQAGDEVVLVPMFHGG